MKLPLREQSLRLATDPFSPRLAMSRASPDLLATIWGGQGPAADCEVLCLWLLLCLCQTANTHPLSEHPSWAESGKHTLVTPGAGPGPPLSCPWPPDLLACQRQPCFQDGKQGSRLPRPRSTWPGCPGLRDGAGASGIRGQHGSTEATAGLRPWAQKGFPGHGGLHSLQREQECSSGGLR